ncbi:Nucleolar pre-ribosomal-associated protein 1 [Phytophthora citrophthora]|uniref:Nucleolar pre-ribosomal-associated protein 1 n=1 Tax=Phytophthora citrophthora TaxID=4793 RepID=A0AAD9LUP7_9STRA|nr:Nucleolar pre-ribosomal-associated protein 1 [Phytophthora citrophthora]
MEALRELLLAAERDRQPLDDAIVSFARALQLFPPEESSDSSQNAPADSSALCSKFLSIHPQGELLLRIWPDQHGANSRWEKRESFATFLHVVNHLLQAQQSQDAAQAEAFALRIIREKTSQLEKVLSWSDKPLIEYRALELLATIAKVAGTAARELVRLFNFQSGAFVKLATRRWKKPEPVEDKDGQEEVKQVPFQLRTAYVDLALALTACPDKSVHRFAMKEGGLTASLFKGMDGDSAEVLTTIFSRLGELVLHNKEVEHKNKLVVFNATCVHQLLALLQVEDDESVRDTALGVLNALFFDDSALYVVPETQALRLFLAKSASNSQGNEEVTTSEQAYALKVIRNAVGTIGVNELLYSSQAQTLVMQFLVKYPGFLSEYLAALSIQLEPKPVYRWFCVASLVQKLLSCSLDAVVTSLSTAKSGDSLSSWCSAQSLASRLIAPGNYRKELSRCIQNSNNLVIYSSLGVIEATLKRYVCLASALESLGLASEVQSELRFLLPSPEALVSLLLKLCTSQERSVALIYVRALTVFRLYLECLPQTMREVKVDFTKTLTWRYLDDDVDAVSVPMRNLIIGEMLRFLLAVDTPRLRFLFTSRSSGDRSKLQQMLLLYVSTSGTVQELAGAVLQRALLASDIFGQESLDGGRGSEEVMFWLESLRHGGSKTCAEFTEQLARAVMADPLVYVAVASRVVDSSASSSLSPITVALVGFFNSCGLIGATDLSLYRDDPCVVAFAVRILLALIPTSKHPEQLVALIASHDAFTDMDVPSKQVDDSQDANGKKRKRSVGSDESDRKDAYAWLKTHCEALASGKPASKNIATPKKKARATSSNWHRFSDPGALTAALVTMAPAELISSWEKIVSNCADVDESFGPVLHYLSARGDVDIFSLLTSKKKQSTVAENFAEVIPAPVVLQHVLFSIASKNSQEQDSAIASMVRVAKDRQVSATDSARMCEQLLFFLSSSHSKLSASGSTQLCELLLFLLTIVLVSSEDVPPFNVLDRILFKLRAVVGSVSNSLLWRQLSAVEMVSLRIYSSNNPETDLSTLCDFGGLFQRTGVPTVAVLASRAPATTCMPVLDSLLRHFSTTTINAPHVVLIERVLESLVDNSKQFESFADYKRAKLLSRKLWQLLNNQHKRQVSFFTTGFTVLGRLGGIEASNAVASIGSSLVPIVVRSAQTDSTEHCTGVLRAIIAAIQCGNEAADFPLVFQEQLLKRLQREQDDRVKCELVGAIYNVFTRIVSENLRQFVEQLIPVCTKRVLLGSQGSYTAELALLQHVSIDSGTNTNALDASAGDIVKKLARLESEERLSSTQLLGLLLLLRNSGNDDYVDVSLLLILVRSSLAALKTAQNDVEKHLLKEYEATMLLIERVVRSLKGQGQEKQLIALKMVLPLLSEAREIVQESASEFGFEGFVKLTAVLLRLVGNDSSSVDFNFKAHFDAVVQHSCFAQTLQKTDNNTVRLLLVRVLAQLVRITGNYTRSILQTLLSSYSMSLSPFDRSLRVLFAEFATQQEELTLVSMGFRFGASSTTDLSSKRSHNDLVDDSAWVLGGGLEQNRIRATVEHFPLEREVSTAGDSSLLELDADLPRDDKQTEAYDPAFLLPMLSHFISSSDLPDGDIVLQGLMGVAIRATSSDVEKMREYAFGILAHLHETLQATTETTSDFKAGRQVHLLLEVFRRGVQEPLQQVPSVVTVFLNDALAVLTRPTHVLYQQVNHFLLARPAMDLSDVPMFYSLFNSRTPLTFRQERSWLLHMLRRGVRGDDDVALLVRRHVLPMLLSFFTSELADTHTQPLITSILLAALRTPSGSTYLVTKTALVEWLAAQFSRFGAVSSSSKPLGSKRTASSALLLPLMDLFEETLQDNVWDELDATQKHATALQAANAFASLQTALTGSNSNLTVTRKAAAVAQLVVRRAGTVCSLDLMLKTVEAVQRSDQDENALQCAEIVTSNLPRWMLQQRHHEAQKQHFPYWAQLLRQVAFILVSHCYGNELVDQQRARRGLEQLKTVLDQLPTMKQLMLEPSTFDQQISFSPVLL